MKASAAMVSLSAIVAAAIAFSPQLFKSTDKTSPAPLVDATALPVGALAPVAAFSDTQQDATAGATTRAAPRAVKPATTDLAEANRKLADAMAKPRAQDGLSQIARVAGGPSRDSAVGRPVGAVAALAYADSGEGLDGAADLIARARAARDGAASSARLLLTRAARVGSAEALTLLGQSYDPVALNELGAKGVRADRAEARKFYQQAVAAGSAEARRRLAKLGS
ncbi:MAG: hypothetical protein HZY79_13210 [Rhodoblastus sp.]|nr:MAG: hypothetical protein HZY79_13210 [Rhodoblastus sp.]